MNGTNNESSVITAVSGLLEAILPLEDEMRLRTHCELPCVESLHALMSHVKGALFPQFFSCEPNISGEVRNIYGILREQVARGLASTRHTGCTEAMDEAERLTLRLIQQLPEIKRLLLTDIAAVTHNDPAANGYSEAVFCYPGVQEMIHYRTAHAMLELGIPMLPRIITEMAHSATGIDIHPAAQIGEYFAIDHGTGIVVGETTIIGSHVMLYQGVTLGARNFQYDETGRPMKTQRHPVVEDNVTIYSNASILGRVRIGHDSVIGGNTWITRDVPPHSRVVQGKE